MKGLGDVVRSEVLTCDSSLATEIDPSIGMAEDVGGKQSA
jgi:hypothetical protein